MPKDEDKKRWKADAQQLKTDLDNRKKLIKKREVPLKFGHPSPSPSPSEPPKQSKSADDIVRRQLGL